MSAIKQNDVFTFFIDNNIQKELFISIFEALEFIKENCKNISFENLDTNASNLKYNNLLLDKQKILITNNDELHLIWSTKGGKAYLVKKNTNSYITHDRMILGAKDKPEDIVHFLKNSSHTIDK